MSNERGVSMVRGIQSFNQGIQHFVQRNGAKNVRKSMELPTMLSLTALGSLGILNGINGKNSSDAFILKCSDHEPETIGDCVTMSYSPVC